MSNLAILIGVHVLFGISVCIVYSIFNTSDDE